MLTDGDTIAKTQSAVVLEKLISQFLFDKAADGSAANEARCDASQRRAARAPLAGGAAAGRLRRDAVEASTRSSP